MKNPFTLSFGKRPKEFVPRYEMMEVIKSAFDEDEPMCNTYLIEGLRGSGKTVLMTAVEMELKKSDEWVAVDLNSTQNLLKELAFRLYKECNKMPGILNRGFSVSFAGFGLGIEKSGEINDHIHAVYEMLDMLKKQKKKILITIDEVVNNNDMRHFASEFQIMLRNEYECFLLMTGLYENIYSIQNDPALTFLLRSPKLALTPLSLLQITKQYARIFDLPFDEAKRLAEMTKGYAFAFQALGLVYFEHHDDWTMDEIVSNFDDLLDDFVYKKIWEGLTDKERLIIRSIPVGGIAVGEICDEISMSPSSFSRYRDKLKKTGLIDASRHGYVSLALPRFEEICQMY